MKRVIVYPELLAGSSEVTMSQNVYTFGYRVPRFHTDFHLLLQIEGPRPTLLDGRCTDISEGGLGAEFNASLEVGMNVNLILTLPDSSTSLRVAARVSNRNGDYYGLSFTFLSAADQDRVRRYIRSLQTARSASAH
jgi:hypothetical protein